MSEKQNLFYKIFIHNNVFKLFHKNKEMIYEDYINLTKMKMDLLCKLFQTKIISIYIYNVNLTTYFTTHIIQFTLISFFMI